MMRAVRLLLAALVVAASLAVGLVVLAAGPSTPDRAALVPAGTIHLPAQAGPDAGLRLWSPCVDLANAERAKIGRAPLAIDLRMARAATAHSAEQAARLLMTHDGANGSDAGDRITSAGFTWSAWGENVARGQRDCAAVVTAWMNSSGHRANILSASYTHIGMGAVRGSNGSIYWTMDLAAAR